MDDFDHDRRPEDEFRPVVDALRAERPALTPLELDELQRRVRMRVSRRPIERSATPMKTRIAILAMLVFGFCFSATGASVAVDGLNGSDDASVAQYGQNPSASPPAVAPGNNVLGEQEGGGNGVAGETSPSAVQPARQFAATGQSSSGSQLPFTGFAAIPLLLIGVGLLAGGFLLHRSARSS